MFDMEENSRGCLHQATILTDATRASDHEFAVRFSVGHPLVLAKLGLKPNRYGNCISRPPRFLTAREICQTAGVHNHKLFGLADKLL